MWFSQGTREREGGLKGKRGQAQPYKEGSDRKLQAIRWDCSVDYASDELGVPVLSISMAPPLALTGLHQPGLLVAHRSMGYTRGESNMKKYVSPNASPESAKAQCAGSKRRQGVSSEIFSARSSPKASLQPPAFLLPLVTGQSLTFPPTASQPGIPPWQRDPDWYVCVAQLNTHLSPKTTDCQISPTSSPAPRITHPYWKGIFEARQRMDLRTRTQSFQPLNHKHSHPHPHNAKLGSMFVCLDNCTFCKAYEI